MNSVQQFVVLAVRLFHELRFRKWFVVHGRNSCSLIPRLHPLMVTSVYEYVHVWVCVCIVYVHVCVCNACCTHVCVCMCVYVVCTLYIAVHVHVCVSYMYIHTCPRTHTFLKIRERGRGLFYLVWSGRSAVLPEPWKTFLNIDLQVTSFFLVFYPFICGWPLQWSFTKTDSFNGVAKFNSCSLTRLILRNVPHWYFFSHI